MQNREYCLQMRCLSRWLPWKSLLGTGEGNFKQLFYNHRMLFNNEGHSTEVTLFKYVSEIKKRFKIMLSLKWFIIKSVLAYLNISKKCLLCLQEKFGIINYPNPNQWFNKTSQLNWKCWWCGHVYIYLMIVKICET